MTDGVDEHGYFSDEAFAAREAERERLAAENGRLLAEFEQSLAAEGLSPRTVRRHVGNAGFYLDCYLLRRDPVPAAEGAALVDAFMGDFFIRKCCATPGTISQTAGSIKRFYAFMRDRGLVSPEDYAELAEDIRRGKPEWADAASRYDDWLDALDRGEDVADSHPLAI